MNQTNKNQGSNQGNNQNQPNEWKKDQQDKFSKDKTSKIDAGSEDVSEQDEETTLNQSGVQEGEKGDAFERKDKRTA
jgi:hypothetical protein